MKVRSSIVAAAVALAGLFAGCQNPALPDIEAVDAAEGPSDEGGKWIANTPQNRALLREIDAALAGVSDVKQRYEIVKARVENAFSSGYEVPAASAGSVVKPYRVTLHSLKCVETEDHTGDDETRLKVYVDGKKVKTWKKSMNNGESMNIGKAYTYNKSFKLKLYDGDNPGFPLYDDDDWLGTVDIKNLAGDEYVAAFNRDGALYFIKYSVEFSYEPPVSVEQRKALLLNDFMERYILGSPIASLTAYDLHEDVEATVLDPATQVDQMRESVCGSVSVVYELARKFPMRYVECCWEIFATKSLKGCNGKTYEFKPSARNELSPADWLLVGLNNSTYSWMSYGEVETTIRAFMPYKTVRTETTWVYGEGDAMRMSNAAIKKGGIAILNVTTKLMLSKYKFVEAYLTNLPNHYIVLRGDLKIDGGNPIIWDSGHYKFNYWTWAKDGWMMYACEDRFEDGFFAATYAY
jgi:hypothetical protein